MGGSCGGSQSQSRSRRGPALPFMDEGPDRGEPMHARAARDREKKGGEEWREKMGEMGLN